jgi:hypothetical protein
MAGITPVRNVSLGLGLGWRVPTSGTGGFASPFRWTSPVSELNLVYHLSWSFLHRVRWSAGAYLSNVDRFRLHNPQQVPFGLSAQYRLAEDWTLLGRCQGAVNGVSSLLLSLSEVIADIGIRYAP